MGVTLFPELGLIWPSFILIASGMVLPLLPQRVHSLWSLATPIVALAAIWNIPFMPGFASDPMRFAGFILQPLYVHTYTHIFATIFVLALFAGNLFALNQKRTTELAAAFIYAGSAVGVTFAGDLITLFIYWEIMALGSTVVIWSAGTEEAAKSGMRYVYMHFIGGVILLAGIAAYILAFHSSDITALELQTIDWSNLQLSTIAIWLMFIGIIINAAAPPFSAWLADAYPTASVSGMVYLSGFTTKTTVFVLLTMFAGNDILIYIGLFMIFYGIIYAILENDMRRILAYSIVNQVGFMVVGAGIGTTLSMHGAAAHAFCHIIYKALLLMSAGSVLYMTGKSKCSDLGGLYHTMKVTMVCGIIGALAISAFPFTSGFISKSMIASAAHTPELTMVWFLLLAASAGVFLHAGIKFPWFVFFQKDSGMRPSDPPFNMQLAMILLALGCLVPGFHPQLVYQFIPDTITYNAYAHGHTTTQLQLLLYSGLAFFLMLPMLRRTETISLDFDWLYRVPLLYILKLLDYFLNFSKTLACTLTLKGTQQLFNTLFTFHNPQGVMARNWPIGVTVLWIVLMLGMYIALYVVM